jgi:hypothetical protein
MCEPAVKYSNDSRSWQMEDGETSFDFVKALGARDGLKNLDLARPAP